MDINSFMKLFIIGLLVMFIGIGMLMYHVLLHATDKGEVSAVGIIMIGPLPIILGVGPHHMQLAIIGLIIIIIILALLLLLGRRPITS